MLSALLLLAAGALLAVHAHGGGGHSSTYRKQDHTGHYAFGYQIHDPWGSHQSRKESGDGWHVKSVYHVDIHHPHTEHWGHHDDGHHQQHHWGHQKDHWGHK